jgi:tetratricopeptide (TPR) repeat protein
MSPLLLLLHLAGAALAADAQTLIRQGRIDEAVPAAEHEAQAAPGDLDAQERWIDLMLALGQQGRVQEQYAKLAHEHPDDPDAHYLVGRAAVDPEICTVAYERALRLNPDHARSYMGLGALARAEGKLREAAEMYQRALRLDPRLAEAWGGLLATTLASGDGKAVLDVARAAVSQVPEAPEGWLALAAFSPDEAGRALREATRRAPWDARGWSALANQLLLEGDASGALDAAKRARGIDPVDKGAILAELHAKAILAGTLDKAGHRALLDARDLQAKQPEAARPLWDTLVTRYPRSALPLLGRASARVVADPAGARADLEKALQLDPKNDEVAATLGLMLAKAGEAKAAAPLLDRAVANRPRDGALALAAAHAHEKAGDAAGAVVRIAAAEQQFPLDLEIAVTHVAMLSAAGRHPEALQVAKDALARMPDLRLELAVAAAAAAGGRYLEAAAVYESLGKRTGKQAFLDTAVRLKEKGGG